MGEPSARQEYEYAMVLLFSALFRHTPRDGRILVTYGGKGEAEAGGSGGKATSAAGQKQKLKQQREEEEEPSVKFLMLNPAVHFDEIVQKVWLYRRWGRGVGVGRWGGIGLLFVTDDNARS